jgi:hypothetical protein
LGVFRINPWILDFDQSPLLLCPSLKSPSFLPTNCWCMFLTSTWPSSFSSNITFDPPSPLLSTKFETPQTHLFYIKNDHHFPWSQMRVGQLTTLVRQ